MINLYLKNYEGVWFGVACDEKRVFATAFARTKEKALKDLLISVPFDTPFQHSEEFSPFAQRVLDALKDIFDGKASFHDFPLAMEHLSNYTQRILSIVRLIPLGYVTSYGAVAKVGGGSARAVGRVMALNPFAPLVPCHRVVCSDFTLGGYGGGVDMKLAFLRRERKGFSEKREISVDGKKLVVFPVEFVKSLRFQRK